MASAAAAAAAAAAPPILTRITMRSDNNSLMYVGGVLAPTGDIFVQWRARSIGVFNSSVSSTSREPSLERPSIKVVVYWHSLVTSSSCHTFPRAFVFYLSATYSHYYLQLYPSRGTRYCRLIRILQQVLNRSSS